MFEKILDPVFRPLLDLGYLWTIVILSFILTLLITLVYKFATNQVLMKKLKAEMKGLQKEAKALRDNPKKAMVHQKKLMEKNMQYMKHSLKPTLYTFIPIIIIFGWLNANLAYYPITPDTEFDVSVYFKEGSYGEISLVLENTPELILLSDAVQEVGSDYSTSWTLIGVEGDYLLNFKFGNREYNKDLIISDEKYAPPEEVIKNSEISKIKIQNKKVRPFGRFLGLNPGWLGAYILLSLLFSFSLRKILKIS